MNLLVVALILFVTTLAIGTYIRRNKEKEVYDGFVRLFGYTIAAINFGVAFMIGLINEPGFSLADKMSSMALSLMVGIVIITMLRLNNKQ